jgi:hypothetical protein
VIVSETSNATALPITQEVHADVSAQFAPHWGDQDSSKVESYESILFETLHHDSGDREVYDVRARLTLLDFQITR